MTPPPYCSPSPPACCTHCTPLALRGRRQRRRRAGCVMPIMMLCSPLPALLLPHFFVLFQTPVPRTVLGLFSGAALRFAHTHICTHTTHTRTATLGPLPATAATHAHALSRARALAHAGAVCSLCSRFFLNQFGESRFSPRAHPWQGCAGSGALLLHFFCPRDEQQHTTKKHTPTTTMCVL